jgi:hypothetical protein
VLGALAGCARSVPVAAPTASTVKNQNSAVVYVSNATFGAYAEPSIASNPTNPDNLVAASMVFNGPARGVETYTSFDGGRTWTNDGLLPGATLDYDADVTVTFDARGNGYVAGWLGSKQQSQRGSARVWRTSDGGRTFTASTVAAPGFMDHPGVATDPSPSSQDLYVAGTYVGAQGLAFTRSTDGGKTFATLQTLDPVNGPKARIPVIAAGNGGTVAVMYFVSQPDGSNVATVITSSDHGNTFDAPTVLGVAQPASAVPGISVRSGPALVADPHSSSYYAAFTTYDRTTHISEIDAYALHDGGSWTLAKRVGVSAITTYVQPQLAVDDHGRIAISAFEVNPQHVDEVLFMSQATKSDFSVRQVVPDSSFDPTTLSTQSGSNRDASNPTDAVWIGDYQGLAATPGAFHPLWNETRTGKLELVTTTVPTPK